MNISYPYKVMPSEMEVKRLERGGKQIKLELLKTYRLHPCEIQSCVPQQILSRLADRYRRQTSCFDTEVLLRPDLSTDIEDRGVISTLKSCFARKSSWRRYHLECWTNIRTCGSIYCTLGIDFCFHLLQRQPSRMDNSWSPKMPSHSV